MNPTVMFFLCTAGIVFASMAIGWTFGSIFGYKKGYSDGIYDTHLLMSTEKEGLL